MIYASPLPRAQITAQYSADLIKVPVVTLDWLMEPSWFDYDIDPADGGKMPMWDIPGEILRANSDFHTWKTWSSTAPLTSAAMSQGVSRAWSTCSRLPPKKTAAVAR